MASRQRAWPGRDTLGSMPLNAPASLDGIVELESGAGFETWQRERPPATLRVHWSATGAVRMHVSGRGAGQFAQPVIRRWEAALREIGRVSILFDLSAMPNYDTSLRQALTDWCLAHRAQISAMHLHTESAVVLMGARVASLLLGGMIEIHATRESFEAVVRQSGLGPIKER